MNSAYSAPWRLVGREIVDAQGRRVAADVSDDEAGYVMAAGPAMLATLQKARAHIAAYIAAVGAQHTPRSNALLAEIDRAIAHACPDYTGSGRYVGISREVLEDMTDQAERVLEARGQVQRTSCA